MMIVMPSLAKSYERQYKVVSTAVCCFISAFTDEVGKRVYAKSSVIRQNSADKESPDKHLPPGRAELRVIQFKPIS